jgi:hypothetical protein
MATVQANRRHLWLTTEALLRAAFRTGNYKNEGYLCVGGRGEHTRSALRLKPGHHFRLQIAPVMVNRTTYYCVAHLPFPRTCAGLRRTTALRRIEASGIGSEPSIGPAAGSF